MQDPCPSTIRTGSLRCALIYLRVRLEAEAAKPTVDEVLSAARADLESTVSMDDILAVQREGRGE